MNKQKARLNSKKLDHDKFDYLRTDLRMEKGILPQFYAIAGEDGVKPEVALELLVRWAVAQGSLCPTFSANASLASDLESIHRDLTRAMKRVRIAVEAEANDKDSSE